MERIEFEKRDERFEKTVVTLGLLLRGDIEDIGKFKREISPKLIDHNLRVVYQTVKPGKLRIIEYNSNGGNGDGDEKEKRD